MRCKTCGKPNENEYCSCACCALRMTDKLFATVGTLTGRRGAMRNNSKPPTIGEFTVADFDTITLSGFEVHDEY